MQVKQVQLPDLTGELEAFDGEVSAELDLVDVIVDGQDFSSVKELAADTCRLVNVVMSSAVFHKLSLSDVAAKRLEAAGLRAMDARLSKVLVENSRLSGSDFGESDIEDCTFTAVKFDECGFRAARLKRVRFESCVLSKAEFTGAKLTDVSFVGCEFADTSFDGAMCRNVDLREQNLDGVQGVLGLKGSIISDVQLMQLAPIMAAELKFIVA